jgi:hypothetical protein
MLKANILASLFLLLSTVLSVTARTDFRARDITKREPTPTDPAPEDTEDWSNGRLLAAGLKLRTPRTLYNPSRVMARQRISQPSGIPQKQCYIKVVRVNHDQGNWDKYVSKDHVNNNHYYGVAEPVAKRMTIQFNPLSPGPFNLDITTLSTYPHFGFAGETLGNNNVFYATDTSPTSPGSTPQAVGNSLAPGVPKSESAIWFYDSSTSRFTAQWVQPNGSIITPKLWFIPNQGAIVLTKNTLNAGWEVQLYCQTYR